MLKLRHPVVAGSLLLLAACDHDNSRGAQSPTNNTVTAPNATDNSLPNGSYGPDPSIPATPGAPPAPPSSTDAPPGPSVPPGGSLPSGVDDAHPGKTSSRDE